MESKVFRRLVGGGREGGGGVSVVKLVNAAKDKTTFGESGVKGTDHRSFHRFSFWSLRLYFCSYSRFGTKRKNEKHEGGGERGRER